MNAPKGRGRNTSKANEADPMEERGRPSGGMTESDADNSRVDVQQSREDTAHKRERAPRVPMVAGQSLNADQYKKEGYKYRWFTNKNDGARLESAVQAWWDFVKDKQGEKVSRRSGPETLFLMCIEDKYYAHDQKLKHKRIIDTIQKENELGKEEYLPDGRHHALQKDDYDPLG